MNYTLQRMDEQDAGRIATWHYDPPYDLYNHSPFDVPFLLDADNRYFAVRDDSGRLAGYCCFGAEARVQGGDYDEAEPAVLDIGVGMHPALVGQGFGNEFVRTILQFARDGFTHSKFRVTIAFFNERSQRTFHKLGFTESQRFTREGDGMDFVQLECEVDNLK